MYKVMLQACVAIVLFSQVFARGIDGNCKIMKPKLCEPSNFRGKMNHTQVNQARVVNFVSGNTTCPNDVVTLEVGETYEIDVNFTPLNDAQRARSLVEVQFGFIHIPIHITDAEACFNKGLVCPLKAGETYDFRPIFQVIPRVPISTDMEATLTWKLVDEKKEEIFCVPFKILVKPQTSFKPQPLFSFHVVP